MIQTNLDSKFIAEIKLGKCQIVTCISAHPCISHRGIHEYTKIYIGIHNKKHIVFNRCGFNSFGTPARGTIQKLRMIENDLDWFIVKIGT